jgi:serine O-acetyltransferase
LTGGNIVGVKKIVNQGEFIIGDECNLGANAVIIGPLTLGNNVQIGACALVIHSYGNGLTLVGNPAKPISHHSYLSNHFRKKI